MADRLKGKVAIVTGAGSSPGEGIGNGRATAVIFAREGASVMLVDINREAAETTRRMIAKEGGEAFVFQADVARQADCRAMTHRCLETYGRIDILHNNVGVEEGSTGGIVDFDETVWTRVMDVNLKSVFLTCGAVIPSMLKQGKGVILNISSLAAVRSGSPQLIYNVSKAGVNILTVCLASEYADKGIRVNAIMPGLIDTPMTLPFKRLYGNDIELMKRERSLKVPMKHMGEGWDVGYAALFLVSDEAKFITGQILAVDGGSAVS